MDKTTKYTQCRPRPRLIIRVFVNTRRRLYKGIYKSIHIKNTKINLPRQ